MFINDLLYCFVLISQSRILLQYSIKFLQSIIELSVAAFTFYHLSYLRLRISHHSSVITVWVLLEDTSSWVVQYLFVALAAGSCVVPVQVASRAADPRTATRSPVEDCLLRNTSCKHTICSDFITLVYEYEYGDWLVITNEYMLCFFVKTKSIEYYM